MRALGPGSLSSFLKIILDVVYVALWVGLGGVAIGILVALLFSFDPTFLGNLHLETDDGGDLIGKGPLLAGVLLSAGVYLGIIQAIVQRLRKVFVTLTAGDPFHPDNVVRLRLIGLLLGGLEISRYVLQAVTHMIGEKDDGRGISLTAWFAVLVVLVMSEVFKEGARLRREAELTI
jgi:uncharacterized membrane protein (DUF373 family)